MVELILSMGMPAIDENLTHLITQLDRFNASNMSGLTRMAKSIAQTLCFVALSFECFQVMLGRRGLDVFKIMRPLALSMVIAFWGAVITGLSAPGKAMEDYARGLAGTWNKEVVKLEEEVAKLQGKYMDRLREKNAAVEKQKEAERDANSEGVIDAITNLGSSITDKFNDFAKSSAIWIETKVTEIINSSIRFVGEIVWQMTYYGILVVGRFFMGVLKMFGPIAFAISIMSPWGSAWSQWVSRYLSVSLYGCLVFLAVCYIDQVILYALEVDVRAYTALLGSDIKGDWSEIGALGVQGIGTTCHYVVAMFVGAFVLRMVPELASWLIPASAAGGIASMAAGLTGAASSVGGAGLSSGVSSVRQVVGNVGRQAGRNLSQGI